jgi:hypothetical protein
MAALFTTSEVLRQTYRHCPTSRACRTAETGSQAVNIGSWLLLDCAAEDGITGQRDERVPKTDPYIR